MFKTEYCNPVFDYRDLREDCRNLFYQIAEEQIKIWSVFGGTPFYLNQINPDVSVEENVKKKILTKGEILYNEPEYC